jgi:hypothetical protein
MSLTRLQSKTGTTRDAKSREDVFAEVIRDLQAAR